MEKEVSEAEKRLRIRKKYLEKIDYCLKKNLLEETDLSGIIRGFFAEFLRLDYEFTYEELTAELDKEYIKPDLKKDIDDFLLSLSEAEYFLDIEVDSEDIKQSLEKMKHIIEEIIPLENQQYKKSIFEKILPPSILENMRRKPQAGQEHRTPGPVSTVATIQQDPVLERATPIAIQESNTTAPTGATTEFLITENNNPEIINVYELVEEAYMHLNSGKNDDAKLAYKKALAKYDNLDLEERQETYIILYDLFLKLKKESS